jgi:DNA processing protein
MPVETIRFSSPEYPERLKELDRPPRGLWLMGSRDTLASPVIAIVGTRRSTHYGERITRELAGALARAGACILSGLARGIDAAAHRAALDVDGRTAAVLGTGVDVIYTRAHESLQREIATRGLLISEAAPGSRVHKGSFPNRNRIIAALADVVIVIEAPIKSGALITTDHALKLGRPIGVVLGNIDSPQSAGSNLLIRDGAHPILCVDDALMLAGLPPRAGTTVAPKDATERRVWDALVDGGASLDELCARTALPVSECLIAVSGLEIRGAVECALTGEIRRR